MKDAKQWWRSTAAMNECVLLTGGLTHQVMLQIAALINCGIKKIKKKNVFVFVFCFCVLLNIH